MRNLWHDNESVVCVYIYIFIYISIYDSHHFPMINTLYSFLFTLVVTSIMRCFKLSWLKALGDLWYIMAGLVKMNGRKLIEFLFLHVPLSPHDVASLQFASHWYVHTAYPKGSKKHAVYPKKPAHFSSGCYSKKYPKLLTVSRFLLQLNLS